MLAVLSEINCLDYLNEKGIYPDEYFTDFTMFKNRCVTFKEATLLIIMAGSCRFNKRMTTELIKSQYKRMENEGDRGIIAVYVLTDSMLPTLPIYYKYENNLDKLYKCKGWSKSKLPTDVWTMVDKGQTTTAHEVALYLSDYDKEVCDSSIDSYKLKAGATAGDIGSSKEDELIRLIQQPRVKELIQQAAKA